MTEQQSRQVRILDDKVVNQIAAGEVVERPASVVKELVENSIDAGATEITVVITNGGRSSIEVIDNGAGMDKHNALLAIERFGTSKINSVDDLTTINTHGFRGEALPSIASVSRLRLSTTPSGAPQGIQLNIEGGRLRDVADVASPPGTRIEVRHLFYNVPARRKFLRSENTEAGAVKALLIDFAVAYPALRFRLVVDGTEAASYLPGRSFTQRAEELKLAGERPIRAEETMQLASGELKVVAVLSQPVDCVVNSGRLRLLVNRRSVRDKLLLKAVRDGYGNFLKPGRYPTGVLSLELPASEVDVNVHPQKTEVRFRRPEIMFAAVTKAIQRSLLGERPEPAQNFPAYEQTYGPTYGVAYDSAHDSIAYDPSSHATSAQTGFVSEPGRSSEQLSFSAGVESVRSPRLTQMRFVGQVLGCFLIFEGNEQLALVDMHAAHERVTFYRLKCQLRGGGVHAQRLLIPEKVTLPPDKIPQFDRFQRSLETLGIETDRIGEDTILIRATPALLGNISPQAIFLELTALPEWADWGEIIQNGWDGALARLACHRSIRSGRELEPPEAYELLELLSEAEASGFCPHGRPIAKLFTRAELERMFGRLDF